MVALAAAQLTWFAGGGDRITAAPDGASEAEGSRAVATKVGGPVGSRGAKSDLSLPTNSASSATPG